MLDAGAITAITTDIFAHLGDGVTFDDQMQSLMAVLVNRAEYDSGTNTFVGYKRDGTTAKVTNTYGVDNGDRATSVIA